MSTSWNFTVRQALQGDLPALQLLFERFYTEEGFADSIERISVNLPQLMRRDDTVVFVAEDADGVVIGSVLVSTMGDRYEQSPEQIAAAVGDIVGGIRTALDA